MITIVTHSGGFHADDVFSIAAFQLLLGKENIEVTRTRDEESINAADYVVDVGGVYDHATKRYDHHQVGAPVRDNGIPYAGFGLMWRHYGEEICGSSEVARLIEERLCQPIDAGDNGVGLYDLNEYGVRPFELYNLVSLFAPAWGEVSSKDEAFFRAVDWARFVLSQMIAREQGNSRLEAVVDAAYQTAKDKSILVFGVSVPVMSLVQYGDVQVVVAPEDGDNGRFKVNCVRQNYDSFETHVSFPPEWAGLAGEELSQVAGIPGLVFCHKARFLCVTDSLDAALAAAKRAT
jgi:uncharacterized UPF0160 family protein